MGRRAVLLLLVLVGCVSCDQASKQAALQWLRPAPSSSYLGDAVRLTYIENSGAFLGLGAHWPEFVRWIAFVLVAFALVVGALVVTVRWMRARRGRWLTPALGTALIAAGGIGNLIDRLTREGAVIDFLNLGVGSLRTGIFNVADVQIVLGLALVFLGHGREREATGRVGSDVAG